MTSLTARNAANIIIKIHPILSILRYFTNQSSTTFVTFFCEKNVVAIPSIVVINRTIP